MRLIKFYCIVILVPVLLACASSVAQQNGPQPLPPQSMPEPHSTADHFSYPVGKTGTVTEAKDRDDWYNAQDFGKNDHLGEDWNKNSGGNTDCGEPVYAAANGIVTFAADAGPGWGNVIIVEHTLSDGKKIESLYGHLQEILKTSGDIKIREQIGKVGNANGRYPCHLHFELRLENCPMWNQAGPGYAVNRTGWTDPSEFIDKHR